MLSNIRKFYTDDGAHTQKYFHENMFVFGGIYDNDQMVCLAMALYYNNGSGNNWTKFLSFVKYFFPTIEYFKSCVISYIYKGF